MPRKRRGAAAEVDLLRLWRDTPPHLVPDDAARVASALLARAQTVPASLRPDTLLLRAEARDAMAWLLLSAKLPFLLDNDPRGGHLGARNDRQDVEGSCLWIAAFHKLPWAWLVLTLRLLRLAKQAEPNEASGYLSLAMRYAQIADIRSPLPVDALDDLGILTEILTPPQARPKEKLPPSEHRDPEEPLFADGPTLRILASIPVPSTSREDKALLEQYAQLARPIEMVPMPDPDDLAERLLTEFPWMPQVVEAIRSDLVLARRLGCKPFRLPPLLLTGPSGVGKSRFARRLAALAEVPTGQLIAAGATDNRALAGTARGWSTTQPCLPLVTVQTYQRANPIIIVDGIDDAGGSARNGAIDRTLLGMLDPASARAWPDECLLVKADLSWVSWILLARREEGVSADLRSRCRILHTPWPRPEDFEVLLRGALADVADEYGREIRDLPMLEPEIVDAIRSGFVTGGLQARQLSGVVRRALAAAADAERMLVRH